MDKVEKTRAEASRQELLRKSAELEVEVRTLQENLSVLENVRARLAHLSERLMKVNQISQELNALDIDRVAKVAVHKISQLLGAKYSSLFLYDHEKDELVLRRHNYREEVTQRVSIHHPRNTAMGLALSQKKTICIQDLEKYERLHHLKLERTFADKQAIRTCLSIPLMTGDFLVGVINFSGKVDGGSFDEIMDVPIAEQLSRVVALALRNCFLFEAVQNQAKTDGLTKLANYRAFHEFLRHEIHRALRYNHPLSVIMMDIDDFKKINDTYGHPRGDFVLSQLGKLVEDAVRHEDIAARYGGDEVAVILPETTLSGAVIAATRLMAFIRNAAFKFQGDTLKVTVSMGIAAFQKPMTVIDFISAADNALYEAKQKGKNQYEIAVLKTLEPTA